MTSYLSRDAHQDSDDISITMSNGEFSAMILGYGMMMGTFQEFQDVKVSSVEEYGGMVYIKGELFTRKDS